MLPGNHDLNIVDRSNPARMDLPTSPDRRLRQLRTLSAMNAVHGDRVRVVDRTAGRLGGTLAEFLKPHRAAIARFADAARPIFSKEIPELWANAFPMVVPPKDEDRTRHHPAQLERRHAFLLHQRARHGFGRADAGLRHRRAEPIRAPPGSWRCIII